LLKFLFIKQTPEIGKRIFTGSDLIAASGTKGEPVARFVIRYTNRA
jgi:hypothetical protein